MQVMNALSLASVRKHFGSIVAVDDLSLDIPEARYVTLLGPSGSGKSTVLRLIAGLEQPDRGTIRIDGENVTPIPPHQRPSAMVFQRYALFPHMTVTENVAFGLRQRKTPAAEMTSRIDEALALVSMSERADAWPHELSGGQEQRVALARALVVRPRILLLDEPLSALDASLRKRMQQELLAIQRQTGITFLAVTHDQDEALTMSDWIVLMDRGRIVQEGTARDLFERPASRFAAGFMGAENVLPVPIVSRTVGSTTVSIAGHDLTLHATSPADRVAMVVRPDAVIMAGPGEPGWDGHAVSSSYKGTTHLVTLALDDETPIVAQFPTWLVRDPAPGDRFRVRIDASRVALVPAD
jgi:spermidine/putrescine transport system ATP-binding protein